MSLFIKGPWKDEGAINHVTQQETEPHDSDPRAVVPILLIAAIPGLLLLAGAVLMWLGG